MTTDKQWGKIQYALQTSKDKSHGQFVLRHDLIYFMDEDGKERLCIPKALESHIFRLAHDECHHSGFHRTFHHISETLYLRKLTRHLQRYITHCPNCNLNQTKRHKPYGQLKPIQSPSIPFHTITLDFIVGLPLDGQPPNDRNALLTITDKFSKRILLISGKDTWGAAEWARTVLDHLLSNDWGVPRAMILDRDLKFLSSFWTEIFKRLETELLVSTTYHLQTDGQSERTNQMVEIALRYYLSKGESNSWKHLLPKIQATLNNSPNASIGRCPNEIVYGFRINEGLETITLRELPTKFEQDRAIIRKEVQDAIGFANAQVKLYYDRKHELLEMQAGDQVYIRLHHGYRLPGVTNHKFSNQRAGPFKILEQKGNLAYKLDLPKAWKIHPVISVAQLEPAEGGDPYRRTRPDHPPAIEQEGDTETWKSYEIEKLAGRRIQRTGRKRTPIPWYLIRWKGYGPAYDEWRSVKDLKNAMELVNEYDQTHGGPPI